MIPDLTISIVLYKTPIALLNRTLKALLAAVEYATARGALGAVQLTLIDNAVPKSNTKPDLTNTGETPKYQHLQNIEYTDVVLSNHPKLIISWVAGHGNIGYGAANNLALLSSQAPYHLVLNPDVEIAVDCLLHGLKCLQTEPKIVLVSPVAHSPAGEPLYLVKRMPTLDVLFLRGFAPKWTLGKLPLFMQQRLAAYEYQEVAFDAPLAQLQIASGAFMLLRQSAINSLTPKGFDARYFLYFEDFDLSLRLSKVGHVVREPNCKIIHAGGGAGKKGLKHIAYFMRSAARFFWQHRQ